MSAGVLLSALAAGVAFITNILISRELGPDSRGEVAFVLQASYLIVPFVLLGAERVALRRSGDQGSFVPVHLTSLCLLVTVAVFALTRDWTALIGPVVYTIATLAVLRSRSFRDNQFSTYTLLIAGYQLTILAFAVTLYLLKVQDWFMWTLAYALPAIPIVVVAGLRRNIKLGRGMFVDVSADSLKLLPASISAVIVTRLDRVILGILAPESQLGLYVSVATATEVLTWLANSLGDHRVSTLAGGRDRRGQLMGILARDCLIFIPIATVAGLTIWLWLLPLLGPAFASAAPLILPLCLAAVMLSLYRQAVSYNLGRHDPTRVTVIEVSTAAVAVPVYFVSIYYGASQGAAWSSLVVYAIGLMIGIALTGRGRTNAD
ncbi:lipopolysaccharide biosynthesis protein [Nakamurella multipartita]|uniref:lipopolysaccharide biosynthesis protein n=1 Tax=Nakamurella multipartita TaxID=53461 RepID=UPI00019E9C86|nr:hypothetical protein [Nakamurella multipartita]